MQTTVKERISKYLEEKNITKKTFCETIGVSQAYISSMRVSIQPDKLYNIALNYPDLNIGWLLTEVGDMYVKFNENKLADDDNKLEDSHCSLYHYTTAEGIIKILESKKIRFSSFLNANDIKEREMYRHFKEKSIFSEKGRINKKFGQKQLDEFLKYISFCKYKSSEKWLQENNNDKERYLFKNNDVMLSKMLGHYCTIKFINGEKRESRMTGACLELDFEKISQISNKMEGLSFFDVEYPKEDNALAYYKKIRKSGKTDEEKCVDDAKFKYKDWESEREYRALYTGSLDGIDITDCIKNIYLGVDFRFEDLKKICDILADKRYSDITPLNFIRLTSYEGGIVSNHKNYIDSLMLNYIKETFPKYYEELTKKIKYIDKRLHPNHFSEFLQREQQEDEEINKVNVEYYRNKYHKLLEENDFYKDKYTDVLEENRKLHNKLDITKDKIIELQDLVIKNLNELDYVKNELAERVSDVRTALMSA